MRILKHLARRARPVGVNRLAKDLGLNASTAHRLLRVFVAEYMASYDPETGLYSVGGDSVRFSRPR